LKKEITLPSPLPNDLALAPLHLELTEPKPGAILQWRSSQQWITVMNRCSHYDGTHHGRTLALTFKNSLQLHSSNDRHPSLSPLRHLLTDSHSKKTISNHDIACGHADEMW